MRWGRPRVVLVVLLAALLLAPQRTWTQRPLPDCPGLANGLCTQRCRETTCRALSEFFRLTYNESNPWEDATGWINLKTQSCQQLLSPARPTPPYCSWFGLTCCTGVQASAGKCAGVGSVQALRLEAMQANASISDPDWMAAVTQLHSCGLTEFTIDSSNLSGNITDTWGRLTNLTVLELSNNWLSGTIPPSLASLTRLTHLGLGTNFFAGPIPPGLGRLTRLRALNLGANAGPNPDSDGLGLVGPLPPELGALDELRELNLETNALTGELPPGLCRPGSQLRVLNLRNNGFKGRATQVAGCGALTQLDLSNNQLTGPLPSSRAWDQLVSYRVNGNQLTGGLPPDLYHVPVLGYLDASNNQLNGTLASAITLLTYLSQLNLSRNRLQGSLPLDLWYLPQLARVDLSANNFTGGLSSAVQFAYGMTELDLSHNPGLWGQLPRELAQLQHLESVDVGATSMACSGPLVGMVEHTALGIEAEAKKQAELLAAQAANPTPCPSDQLLPCFLRFADYYVPRDDESHMACRPIRRKPPGQVLADCAPEGESGNASTVAEGLASQTWAMDPAYYQYRNCRCLDGWVSAPGSNATWLACVPAPPENRAWVMSLVQGCVALAVVLGAGLVAWRLMALYFKPRWLREKEMMAKRRKPAPTAGDIAMVVTDIEGYSDLMSSAPQLTMRALALHNAVIRRVCQQHAGHVVEQEGDSFTCVFHEPGDAVAFCLQSQLALFKLDWPRGLTGLNNTAGTADPATAAQAHAALTDSLLRDHSMDSNGWAGWGSYLRAKLTGKHMGGSSQGGSGTSAQLPRATSGTGLAARGASFTSIPSASSDSGILPRYNDGCGGPGGGGVGGDKEESTGSFTSSATAPLGAGWRSGSLTGRTGERQAPGDALPTIASIASADSRSSGSKGRRSLLGGSMRQGSRSGGGLLHGSRVFSLFFKGGGGEEADEGEAALFRGLRVRMGVASGHLPPGQDLSSCAIKDLAAEVSNLAHGGQVLMEGTTFAAVHGFLGELGALDARGYNHKLLSAKQRAAFRTMLAVRLRWLCSCIVPIAAEDAAAATRPALTATDAVALDMGSYLIPGVARTPSPTAPASSGWNKGAGGGAGAAGGGGRRGKWAAALSGALAGLSSGGSEEDDPGAGGLEGVPLRAAEHTPSSGDGLLHVYSISSPALVGRARLWGSRLTFDKQGTRQVSKAYFDAPGTLMSDLDPSKADSESLPPVSMVFVMVEGAKAYARRKRSEAARVHALLHGALTDTLAHFADGYLCREQDGDFKYMVAFMSAASALEWCLLMQEVALHLPWPPAVLGVAGWREVRGPGGELLFRGPRLKMGLCEGRPRAIIPDHLGRADYHGNSINAAARFCAAAAQGGQVVLEEALALKVLGEAWLPRTASHTSSSGEEGARDSSAGSEPDALQDPAATDQTPATAAAGAAAATAAEARLVALGSSHPLSGTGQEEEAGDGGEEAGEEEETEGGAMGLSALGTSPAERVVLSESSYPPAATAAATRQPPATTGTSRLQRSSSTGGGTHHQLRGGSAGGAVGLSALPEPHPTPVLVAPRQVSFSGRTVSFSGRLPSFTATHNASFTTQGGTSSCSTPLGSPLVMRETSLPHGTSPRSALRRAGSEPGGALGSPMSGSTGLGGVEEGGHGSQRQRLRSSSGGRSRRRRRCNSDADSLEMTRLIMGGGLPGVGGSGVGRTPPRKPREVVDVTTPPAPRVPMRVAFTRLGTWSFKGTGTTRLVAAATNALIGRTFPVEAAGGKGALLEPPSEPLVMEDAEVPLQDLITPAAAALEAARRQEAALLAEVRSQPDAGGPGAARDAEAAAAAAKVALLRRGSMPASAHTASAGLSVGGDGGASQRAFKRTTTVASGARTAELGQAVVQLRQVASGATNRQRQGGLPVTAPAGAAAAGAGAALQPTQRSSSATAGRAGRGAAAAPAAGASSWLDVDERVGGGSGGEVDEAALVRQVSGSGAVGSAFSERAGRLAGLDPGELAALRDQQQAAWGGEEEV